VRVSPVFCLAPLLAVVLAGPASASLLVVPAAGANAAVVDAGVRAGLAGVDAADAAVSASTVADAKAAGFSCAVDDSACWFRVADLGGFSGVVVPGAGSVALVDATGTQSAPVFGGDAAAWTAAVRRARKLEGALRVQPTPADATVVVDGAVVASNIVVVAPGAHKVEVVKDGFAVAGKDVVVDAGAVVDVELALVEQAAAERSLTLPLAVGLGGAAVGGAVILIGQAAGGCLPACAGEEGKDLANQFLVPGVAVIAVALVAGGVVYFLDDPQPVPQPVPPQGRSAAAIPPAKPATVAVPSKAPPTPPMVTAARGSVLSGATK
jgi:hypothetical protein